MKTKQARIKKQLLQIIAEQPETIRAEVAQKALDYGDNDFAYFFKDLLQHGCISGMVGSLIYYTDTRAFYDRHYHEIETLRYDLEESFGEPLKPEGDLKNWYAWLGFEETARQIAEELDIEW